MGKRLRLSGVLQTRAAFEPASFNEQAGTVEVTFTTGARGLRRSFIDGPYFEELEVSDRAVDLSRMNNGASVLNAHSSMDVRDVIGVVERAWVHGREGRAAIRFSEREDVKSIKADVRAGIIRHISVGYSVQKYEKVEETDGVPVYRATRWTPAELSLVPVAFDDGATVRSREAEPYEVELQSNEETNMPDAARTDTNTTDAAAEQARAEAARRAAAEAEQAGAARERTRITEIQQVVRALRLAPEVAARHIESGASAEDVRRTLVAEAERQNAQFQPEQHTRYEPGEDVRDKFRRGAAAAIYQRAMLADPIRAAMRVERFAHLFQGVSFDPGEFAGARVVDIAARALELRGQSIRGLYGEALVRRALEFRDAGMNTTSDFPVLLEDIARKSMLAQYATTPDKWRAICAVKPLTDFRVTSFFRTGSFSKLDAVTEAGEFKHKNIPDGAKATLQLSTYGNIVGITRKALVNDDLGALTDQAAGLGRSAALTVEEAVFALLLLNGGLGPTMADGQPLFHANRANIGPTGAMTVTTLDGARQVMAAQKDISGNEILDLRPAIWLGPLSLGGAARVANGAEYEPTVSKFQVPNIVRGMVREVVDTARLTGTRHYLFADPSAYPTFAVAFLDGQQAPELRTEQNFEYDGVQWRVRLDFGTGVLDWKGAVTLAGA